MTRTAFHPTHFDMCFTHEAAERATGKAVICEESARSCSRHFGDTLRAVVLTGSLARGEATFIVQEGKLRLLGDVDLLLVFEHGAELPSPNDVGLLARAIEANVLVRGILCHISFGVCSSDYFGKLRPAVYSYELRNAGVVILGDSQILSFIPNFPASEIPLEDALRLVCNRIAEQFDVINSKFERGTILPLALFYRTVKLYLDLATSLLLFAGEYAPSYSERALKLKALARSGSKESQFPLDLHTFSEKVDACTKWKLLGEAAVMLDIEGICESVPRFAFWEEAIAMTRSILRWELERLTHTHREISIEGLMKRWMRRQLPHTRLRGWIYVLREQGWYRSWRQWPHWARLAWRASPRFWVYTAASRLLFSLPDLMKAGPEELETDIDWQELQTWLPVRFSAAAASTEPRMWLRLVPQIAWNYHHFLEGTRA